MGIAVVVVAVATIADGDVVVVEQSHLVFAGPEWGQEEGHGEGEEREVEVANGAMKGQSTEC